MTDYEITVTTRQCKFCNEKYSHIEPKDCCNDCIINNIVKKNSKSKHDSRWKKIKRITYCVLLTMPPLYYVGCKYGLKFEYISLSFFVVGLFVDDIIDCLVRIF